MNQTEVFIMKKSTLFVTLLFISGLFFVVSSSAMAKTRFSLEKESIENIVEQSRNGSGLTSDGHTEIISKVRLHNNGEKPLAFDVTVTFVNSEKARLGEATKTCKIGPNESKTVSNLILLDPDMASQIDTGYVTIANEEDSVAVETHSIVASVSDNLKEQLPFHSDRFIKVDYNVKLRNKSDKPVSSDLIVAFLDEDEMKIGEARTTGSFEAGELKTISDTVVLRTSDASRIASSRVTIQK
jgi:hypothetical protein